MIDRTYRIDTRSQTIFGHSLGDLCCIHFLRNLLPFRHTLQEVLSIHWNEKLILKEEEKFLARLEKEKVHTDLLVEIGELEKYRQSQIRDNVRTAC
ncbi:putative alpha/beta superfamily hydrolase [Anoxybacillus caldiproteolyticus]|uniref:Putative alpha/beta superfamily hydrolase n=2 Tax=Thermaerobacillus caldiproteolyticus TaxID=247480 RepID=A0A7W0BZV9_9BACL|nr:putative alpha/beta superfamily hydrolase [Anoxybacillus caldiproteolyticus]